MTENPCIALGKQVFMETYAQYPVVLSSGKGCRLYDNTGKSYLDMVAGIAVNALGYGDQQLNEAIGQVLQHGLLHCSNLYWNEPAVNAAARLVQLSGMDRVFFCNSGTEANEAALKLARKYGASQDPHRTDIITMAHSFHGRTYGSMTATGQTKYQASFTPLVPGFSYAPYNDLDGVKATVTDRTCAILVEPIQGEGGVIAATGEFLKGLRKLCDEKDILLMFDEVQCGMGRTGTSFAWQAYGVVPDVMTLAKALGAGFPIGAMVAKGKAATVLAPGDHAATFGGNLVATTAANVILERLAQGSLLAHVQTMSTYLTKALLALQKRFPAIVEVRGKGLMLGMEMRVPVRPLIAACMENGLLIANAGPNVLRFVPPLVISLQEIDEALAILTKVLENADL
ncbi:MAG: aspartate aminotransferase family protein [Sphaerochaetaceae bacterium]